MVPTVTRVGYYARSWTLWILVAWRCVASCLPHARYAHRFALVSRTGLVARGYFADTRTLYTQLHTAQFTVARLRLVRLRLPTHPWLHCTPHLFTVGYRLRTPSWLVGLRFTTTYSSTTHGPHYTPRLRVICYVTTGCLLVRAVADTPHARHAHLLHAFWITARWLLPSYVTFGWTFTHSLRWVDLPRTQFTVDLRCCRTHSYTARLLVCTVVGCACCTHTVTTAQLRTGWLLHVGFCWLRLLRVPTHSQFGSSLRAFYGYPDYVLHLHVWLLRFGLRLFAFTVATRFTDLVTTRCVTFIWFGYVVVCYTPPFRVPGTRDLRWTLIKHTTVNYAFTLPFTVYVTVGYVTVTRFGFVYHVTHPRLRYVALRLQTFTRARWLRALRCARCVRYTVGLRLHTARLDAHRFSSLRLRLRAGSHVTDCS